MSIKDSLRSALLMLMLFTRSASAQVDAKLLPNVDSLDQATQQIRAGSCRQAACRAITLIDQAVHLQIAGASATVGRPRPVPLDRGAKVARSYRRLVAQGRRMAPELCRTAASLLAHYGARDGVSEVIVPVSVLDLTSRLDSEETGLGCTRSIVRTMPATSAAGTAIHNARSLCTAQGGAGRCAAIAR